MQSMECRMRPCHTARNLVPDEGDITVHAEGLERDTTNHYPLASRSAQLAAVCQQPVWLLYLAVGANYCSALYCSALQLVVDGVRGA